jgi:Phage major capsid protein E
MAQIETANEELYQTRTILEATVNLPPAPQFVRNTLFGRTETTTADKVVLDYYKGTQKLAPFVSRRKRGISLVRDKFRTSEYSPPHIRPVKDLRSDDLMMRVPGDSVYSSMTGAEREAHWLILDWNDLDARISRTEEWMCCQALFQGKIEAYDADDLLLIDTIEYGVPTQTVVSVPWTDPTSDPFQDLKLAMRAVTSACGSQATLVLLGSLAADAFESNEKVKSMQMFPHAQQGLLDPKLVDYGVFILSTYRSMPIYASEAVYESDDGSVVPYVPANMCLVAAQGIQHKMAYAGCSQVDPDSKIMDVFEGSRIPQVYYDESFDVRRLRLSSRPCPVVSTMDSWTIMTVC